ncbi:complement C1s subcomponent-like [Lissotriton helveticus]
MLNWPQSTMRTYTWLFLVSCFPLQGTAEVLFGQISSPGYPGPYPPNRTMTWTISVPEGRRIKLQFTHFDVGDGNEHCEDYVKVIDVGQPLATVCGHLRAVTDDIPEPLQFISFSNVLTLTFASQPVQSRHYRGFRAVYAALAHDECANRKTPCAHYCHSHPEGYFCSCAHGYVLGRDKASCEESETAIECGLPEEIDNGYISYLSHSNSTTYGATIQYHCVEPYYELPSPGKGIYSCSADGEWVNSQARTELPTCAPVCGVSVDLSVTGRIFGGTRTKDGMFPWQVFFENPRGGGALISDEWVLTAAHVVEEEENPTMYAGTRDLIRRGHQLVAKKVFVHDKWKRGVPGPRTDYDNDIALIKLETKVALSHMVSPICLPGPGPEYTLKEGKIGYISGWGSTETRYKGHRILNRALISIVKMAYCQNEKPEIGDSSQYVFSSNMICAGGHGKDSCEGDAGGSFVVRDPHNDTLYFAAGIVSWGPKCGTFGLYTNVRNYLDWIKKTMMENKDT